MRTNIFFKISFNVFLIFAMAILMSFIPDYFSSFFGDKLCEGTIITEKIRNTGEVYNVYSGCLLYNRHSPELHWGYRHYLWAIMGFILFLIQCFRISLLINQSN